jgi:hypothetical protein
MTEVAHLPRLPSAAERMRLYRERRRRGLSCIKVQLRRSEVDALSACGLLQPVERQDRNAFAAALHRYLDANPIAGRGQERATAKAGRVIWPGRQARAGGLPGLFRFAKRVIP